MRRVHPLRRGFLLAFAVVVIMLAAGRADSAAMWNQAARLLGQGAEGDPFALAWTAMVIPGAFLAFLPRLLRRRGRVFQRPSLRRCLAGFGGGVLLTLGLGIAGGDVLSGVFSGSVSAYAFLLSAWAAGFLALRLRGRRRA